MIKLFLAEDEIAMREGIRKLLSSMDEGIAFCGEAGDGELAWPMILKERPDIVITDIKMPFMDGLELSALIRKELPDTRIVILSGYSEFEYAQEALRIGVTEYLLKPITPKKLREVIKKLAESIEEERRSKAEKVDLLAEELREKAERDRSRLLRILIASESGSTEILTAAERMDIRLSGLSYRILLIFLGAGSGYRAQTEADGTLKRLSDGIPGSVLFEHSPDSRLLLLSAMSHEESGEKLRTFLAAFPSAIAPVRDLHYYVFLGRPVERLSAISEVYREVNRAAAYRFFLPPDQVIEPGTSLSQLLFGQKGTIDTDAALRNGNMRAVWENFLRTGTLSEAGDFVEDAFSSVGEGNSESTLFLTYLTMDCYFCMVRFLKDLGKETEEVNESVGDINLVIGAMKSSEDARRYLRACLEAVIRQRDGHTLRKNSQLLSAAVSYIDEHYTDSSLSLQSVADAAGISPNRFSALFSHEMGMTFIEYLIGKRMDRAAELLMTTDLKSFEVAYESGYNDPHYFSSTFKKIKGMSPMEYRRRRAAGEEDV